MKFTIYIILPILTFAIFGWIGLGLYIFAGLGLIFFMGCVELVCAAINWLIGDKS